MRALLALRSALYVTMMTVTVIPYSFIVLAGAILPMRGRYWLAQRWTKLALWGAQAICGIRWRVEGWENLPQGPAILLPKHQSAWETMWLPSVMPQRLSFVYKRELHYLPFFGWAMATLGMINIDRSRGQDAFEQVVQQGTEHLADDWWIVIFPEGTRTAPGSTKRYKTGGARLAARTGVPVVPIAVNSGEVWPRNAFIKTPGLVTVVIGKPIESRGKSADELSAQVESFIETEMRRIAPHRYAGPYSAERSNA